MTITRVQIDRVLDLAERFVEAQETLAEVAVRQITNPSVPQDIVASAAPTPTSSGGSASNDGDSEPDLGLDFGLEGGEQSEDDGASTPEDTTTLTSDTPPAGGEGDIDLNDPKAVEDLRQQVMNVLKDYSKEGGDVPVLLDEVTGVTKFSEVSNEMLIELHDAAHDALAAL